MLQFSFLFPPNPEPKSRHRNIFQQARRSSSQAILKSFITVKPFYIFPLSTVSLYATHTQKKKNIFLLSLLSSISYNTTVKHNYKRDTVETVSVPCAWMPRKEDSHNAHVEGFGNKHSHSISKRILE